MAMAITLSIWYGAIGVFYVCFLVEPIYTVFYILSSALLIFGKIQMYEGNRDLVAELFEDFYGLTTVVVMLVIMPVTFLIMEDK